MSERKFIVIAITSPDSYPDEAGRIENILGNGEADLVHIRKPLWNKEKTSELLKAISEKFHHRLKLHDHFELLEIFNLGGVHLNSRNQYAPLGVSSVSKSIHSLKEIEEWKDYDYMTLSPIFDSISKQGYKSSFDLTELKSLIEGKNLIALGGVSPNKFNLLKYYGFKGAALLGHFFPSKPLMI
ncbi:MAG: thiamine phosphate synthase [Muribaculaceae bacterium]|nr:thiamine phosphate synthase [Muribaculaceae bacterium]